MDVLLLQQRGSVWEEADVNPMCEACAKLGTLGFRRDRYKNCKGVCKALAGFLGLTKEEVKSINGRAEDRPVHPLSR